MPHRKVARVLWANLAVIVLVGSAVANSILFTQTRSLASENQNRIDDIQVSRVTSCRQTYEGVREVFKPFFRAPKVRTAKERRDIAKFNHSVNRLKARCDTQTRPG